MCGFTGFIDFSENSEYDSILKNCHDLISFRGPDQNNQYINKSDNIFISFERLSFLDLSKNALQPLFSNDGRYLILLNGEIYNFSILAKELSSPNLNLNLKSDTAVAIEYIAQFGIKNFLKKAFGMFAIVVIDLSKKKINLISDPFLQKPLYYSLQNNILYFSSDIRTIHTNYKFSKVINKIALQEYFNKSFISSPSTIYNNVYKLEPLNIIEFSFEKKSIRLNKSVFYDSFEKQDNEEYEKNLDISILKKNIEDSILNHLEADVQIGTFLSSGIDSSLITAIASKHKSKIESFSLGFTENNFDESKDAQEIANFLNVKHHVKIFNNSQLEENILNTSLIYSEPFADSSQIPFADLCKFTSNYVKGVLSGDGGDEIFGGYHRHTIGPQFYKMKKNTFLKNLFKILLNLSTSKFFIIFMDNLGYSQNTEKLNRLKKSINAKNIEEFYDLLTSHTFFKDIVINYEKIIYSQVTKQQLDPTKYIMLRDLTQYMPNDILVKSDRASMYHSLEIRSPFLNLDLARMVNRIDNKIILKNNEKKHLLKSLLKDYLPNKIINFKKKGFQAPISKWLKKELVPMREYYFARNKIDHGLFNYSSIEKNLSDFDKGKQNQNDIWNLLIFQIWFDKYK